MKPGLLHQEVLITSEYTDSIIQILKIRSRLSITKTLLFSYVLRRESGYFSNIYDGKTKNGAFFKCVSTLCGSFDDFCSDLEFSIQSVDLLTTSNIIAIDDNIITYLKSEPKEIINPFLELAIEESFRFSDRQILKEVLRNV